MQNKYLTEHERQQQYLNRLPAEFTFPLSIRVQPLNLSAKADIETRLLRPANSSITESRLKLAKST